MKEQKLHTTNQLRFRRWSRASFALFASMSTVVSIGFLSVSVTEKSLVKNESCATNSLRVVVSSYEETDSDEECKQDFLQSLQEIILITNSSNQAAACSEPFLYIFNQTD
jgi:hypothetical protein